MQPRYRQMTGVEKLRLRHLRNRERLSFKAIADTLSQEAADGRKFDRVTIYRAYKSMPDLPVDAPFQWHKMNSQDNELPWGASAYLLEFWRFALESSVYPLEDTAVALPSVREARWWWRVHLADPDLEMSGVLNLAKAFELRELFHDVLGIPLEVEDLEALLGYKPWQDDEKLHVYLRAIEEKRIPFISGLSMDRLGKVLYEMPDHRDIFFIIVAGVDLFKATIHIQQEGA